MKQAISQTGHFNIFDTENYSGGGALPEGYYAIWFDYFVRATGKDGKALRGGPGVNIRGTCVNLADPNAAPTEAFWSLGKEAMKSFIPDPESDAGQGCKRLKQIPGAPGSALSNLSNWFVFLDNLKNCTQLPQLGDSLQEIDGIWLHIQHVDPPTARAALASRATSEYQGEENQGPQKIPVPAQVLPGGKPWEGGGGMPTGPMSFTGAAPAAQAAAPAPALPPARTIAPAPPVARPPAPAGPAVGPRGPQAPKPAAAQVAQTVNVDDLPNLAGGIVTDVIVANPDGMPHIAFRAAVFTKAKEKFGEDTATAIAQTYFTSTEYVNLLLNPYGYKTNGAAVTRA